MKNRIILFNDIRAIQPYIWFVFRVLFFRYVWRYDNCIVYGSNCFIIRFCGVWPFCCSAPNEVAEKSENIQCHVPLDLQCGCFYRSFPVFCYQ